MGACCTPSEGDSQFCPVALAAEVFAGPPDAILRMILFGASVKILCFADLSNDFDWNRERMSRGAIRNSTGNYRSIMHWRTYWLLVPKYKNAVSRSWPPFQLRHAVYKRWLN